MHGIARRRCGWNQKIWLDLKARVAWKLLSLLARILQNPGPNKRENLMSVITLKSLHNYLKLLENPSELKRRLPASSNPRTLKEGLFETSRLVAVNEAVFKDPQSVF